MQNLIYGTDYVYYNNALKFTDSGLEKLAVGILGVHDHVGGDGAQIDHGGLAGLTDDDHSGYDKLAGRAGGQTSYGGTASGEDRKIISTSHATKGSVYIGGDGGTTDYAEFESDGTLRFAGASIVYDDIRINPGSFDRPGVSDPALVAYDVNGGGVSTYLYEFEKNDIASFTVQIPHSYAVGQDIKVHIHWTPGPRGNEESGAVVGWKIDYSWANIGSNFGTMATLDLQDVCDGTDHKHQMTPDVTITGTDKGISSMLLCNIKRTDTGTDDTWAGTANGQLPMLLEIDFHFPIDTLGSRDWASK
jgi:hypothetical protein